MNLYLIHWMIFTMLYDVSFMYSLFAMIASLSKISVLIMPNFRHHYLSFVSSQLHCYVFDYFTFFRYKCQCLICYTKNTCHFFVTALFLSDLIRCCKLPTVAGMCILTWRNRHRSWCQQIVRSPVCTVNLVLHLRRSASQF